MPLSLSVWYPTNETSKDVVLLFIWIPCKNVGVEYVWTEKENLKNYGIDRVKKKERIVSFAFCLLPALKILTKENLNIKTTRIYFNLDISV